MIDCVFPGLKECKIDVYEQKMSFLYKEKNEGIFFFGKVALRSGDHAEAHDPTTVVGCWCFRLGCASSCVGSPISAGDAADDYDFLSFL